MDEDGIAAVEIDKDILGPAADRNNGFTGYQLLELPEIGRVLDGSRSGEMRTGIVRPGVLNSEADDMCSQAVYCRLYFGKFGHKIISNLSKYLISNRYLPLGQLGISN